MILSMTTTKTLPCPIPSQDEERETESKACEGAPSVLLLLSSSSHYDIDKQQQQQILDVPETLDQATSNSSGNTQQTKATKSSRKRKRNHKEKLTATRSPSSKVRKTTTLRSDHKLYLTAGAVVIEGADKLATAPSSAQQTSSIEGDMFVVIFKTPTEQGGCRQGGTIHAKRKNRHPMPEMTEGYLLQQSFMQLQSLATKLGLSLKGDKEALRQWL